MATVLAFSRALSTQVHDLATTRQRIDSLAETDDAATGELWNALTDRKALLEDEIKADFYALTGVSADMFLAALS